MQRNHFVALDSWRGICALMVAAGHLKTSGLYSSLLISTTSYRFVDFFFVLSGFVIAHAARDSVAANGRLAWGFMLRRLGRLWPLHIALLAGFAIWQFALLAANNAGIDTGEAAFVDKFDPLLLPANLLLVQGWGFIPFASWNGPAWSISTEVAAYIAFAACFGLFGRRGWMPLLVIGTVALAVLLVVGATAMQATYGIALARCLAGFVAGVFVHALWTEIPDIRVPQATAIEAATVILVFLAVSYLPLDYGVVVIPLFAATVLLFAYEQGAVSRWLRRPLGKRLGELSFSIYMVHALLAVGIHSAAALAPRFGIANFALGPVPFDNRGIVTLPVLADLLILAFLALTIAISMLSFRWIERPWRDRAKVAARKLDARLTGVSVSPSTRAS